MIAFGRLRFMVTFPKSIVDSIKYLCRKGVLGLNVSLVGVSPGCKQADFV